MTADFRLGLVGCGAVSAQHLRGLGALGGASCVALLDTRWERAEAARTLFAPAARVVGSLDEMAGLAEAVIVASPTRTHHDIVMGALARGLHVLCEKPLSTSAAEGEAMVAAAAAAGRILACGLVRRFFPAVEVLARALDARILGQPLRCDVRESVVDWPFTEESFDPSIGGVLQDTGPHVLDLLQFLLGSSRLVHYADDAGSRAESRAVVDLACQKPGGPQVPVRVRLARAVRFRSTWTFFCEKGQFVFEPRVLDRVRVSYLAAPQLMSDLHTASPYDPFTAQLADFSRALRTDSSPRVPGGDTLPALQLVEEAYATRRALPEPWAGPPGLRPLTSPRRGRILVTGATGRIGARLVEMWAAAGRLGDARFVVRNLHNAARMLRFEADVVQAALDDPAALRAAMNGCHAVVHLAAGDNPGRETAAVVAAASSAGLDRLVHMSSAAVYGLELPARIEDRQEATALQRTGQLYADGKAAAEAAAQSAPSGIHVVMLRPQVVYGPGMRWSIDLVDLLAAGRIAITEPGGTCNLVYIDDLIRAVDAALDSPTAARGEAFFVTDGCPTTWRAYIEAHAALLRTTVPVVPRVRLDKTSWWRQSVRPLGPLLGTPEFRDLVTESPLMRATVFRGYLALRDHRTLGPRLARLRHASTGLQVPAYDPLWSAVQTSEARLSGEKAASMLGFRAAVDFADGLARTASWLRQLGLLPDDVHGP